MKTIKCIKDVVMPFDKEILLYKKGKTYEYTKKGYGISVVADWNNIEFLISYDDMKSYFRKWDILKVKIL